MTQPADSFSTYDAIGNREDLANIIYDISPTDTPFMSGIAKVTASATLHEWQTDSLATANPNNAVIEGDDATTDAGTPTVRLNNQSQISDKVPRVTGTQRAIDSAGRADEFAYQIMKAAKELKTDVESALLADKIKVVGNDSTARETAGIGSWIATNIDFGVGGSAPTGDGTDVGTTGTNRAFTEAQLTGVLEACYNSGGNPDMIMVGATQKSALSGFTGNATRNINSGEKKLVNAINVYVGDFGDLVVVPNRFQEQDEALILEMDMWAMAVLRDFQEDDLAKTGDTDRKQLIVEYTLESRNEAASGSIRDLT